MDIGCGPREDLGDIRVDISRDSKANIIADAEHLPFQDEVFNIITARHVLEHLPSNPFDNIGEWSYLLKQNGLLVVYTPTENWSNLLCSIIAPTEVLIRALKAIRNKREFRRLLRHSWNNYKHILGYKSRVIGQHKWFIDLGELAKWHHVPYQYCAIWHKRVFKDGNSKLEPVGRLYVYSHYKVAIRDDNGIVRGITRLRIDPYL